MLKNKKLEWISFLVGIALLGYLISKFGVDRLSGNIEQAGWSLLYIIGVWFLIYVLNTVAWKVSIGSMGRELNFPYLFMVTVSGFGINYITPLIALGGEPYKIKALIPALGTHGSISAVVIYRLVHLLGHMLLLLTGILVALIFLTIPPGVAAALVACAVIVAAVIGLSLYGSKNGVFTWLERILGRFPLLKKFAPSVERQRDSIEQMDKILSDSCELRSPRFYLAVFLEYLSRALMSVEVYVILRGAGLEISAATALFLFLAYSVVINLMFFVPMNVGAREGGLLLALQTLALPPLLGVYLGVIMRIREFFWILLGLLFIPFTRVKRLPVSQL